MSALIANEPDPAVRKVWTAQEQRYLEGLFYTLSYKADRVYRTALDVQKCYEAVPAAAEFKAPVFDQVKVSSCQEVFGEASVGFKLELASLTVSCGGLNLKVATPEGLLEGLPVSAYVTASQPF